MRKTGSLLTFVASRTLMAAAACSCQSRAPATNDGPRKGKRVTITQSGPADFVSSDNVVYRARRILCILATVCRLVQGPT